MNLKYGYRYSHNFVHHTTVRFFLSGWVSYVLRYRNCVMIVISTMDVTVVEAHGFKGSCHHVVTQYHCLLLPGCGRGLGSSGATALETIKPVTAPMTMTGIRSV
jgi:hypothetical protein